MSQETAETLRQAIRSRLGKRKFVAVSNREPYLHQWCAGQIQCVRPVGGLTAALDPVMQASRGVWVAHGSGEADAATSDERGILDVPPGHPSYRLKRVWLSPEQTANYYDGFANSALWPLCHVAYRQPIFREEHWQGYREVNELFAERVAEEVGDAEAFVFVQDYHLALLPRLLRRRCPRAVIAHFWHIPWPNSEVFRICPWRVEILQGMLASDVLAFHIRNHGYNFIDTVDRELEARADRERMAIVYHRRMTKIRAFPISIDFEAVSRDAASPATSRRIEDLRRQHGIGDEIVLGVGADRIDYTKGLPERIDALGRFLERNPAYHGRLVFLQAGAPSRMEVDEYARLNEELDARICAINQKYGTPRWRPVIFLRQQLPLADLLAWYRMARFGIVSSLHDGMNLVAKEFVAARVDGAGVLLLSRFTGAARQLREAVQINPYAADEVAEAVREAIEMDPEEVRRRMARMRRHLRENNVYKWAVDIVNNLSKLV